MSKHWKRNVNIKNSIFTGKKTGTKPNKWYIMHCWWQWSQLWSTHVSQYYMIHNHHLADFLRVWLVHYHTHTVSIQLFTYWPTGWTTPNVWLYVYTFTRLHGVITLWTAFSFTIQRCWWGHIFWNVTYADQVVCDIDCHMVWWTRFVSFRFVCLWPTSLNWSFVCFTLWFYLHQLLAISTLCWVSASHWLVPRLRFRHQWWWRMGRGL